MEIKFRRLKHEVAFVVQQLVYFLTIASQARRKYISVSTSDFSVLK